jgi:hypothetical protein
MKPIHLLAALSFACASLVAAENPELVAIKAAAKKLSESGGYSWHSAVKVDSAAGASRMRPSSTEGKIDKEGLILLVMTRGEDTLEAVLKGSKGALKSDGNWKSIAEAAQDDSGGQFTPLRFMARILQDYKAPTAEVAELAGNTKELKLAEGAYSGELTEKGANQLLTFRRAGADALETSGAKGSVKIWLKDGMLSKYEYHIQGKISFNGNDREIDRTTTVEIKEVGGVKVTVPEEAAKKLT